MTCAPLFTVRSRGTVQVRLGVTLALRTEWLQAEVMRLQEAVGLLGGAGFTADLIEARDAGLHFELNALRREVTERLDRLPCPPGEAAARGAAGGAGPRPGGGYAGDPGAAAGGRGG